MIVGFALARPVDKGGYLRIAFPSSVMTVSSGVSGCTEIDRLLTFSSCRANTDKNYIELITGIAITLDGTTSPSY